MGLLKSNKFHKLMLWGVFYSCFGFAGGGYFLLYLVVPIEAVFVEWGKSQNEIDEVLKYVVYGWVVFGTLVAAAYYWWLLRRRITKLSIVLAVFCLMNAGAVFYMFVNTDTALIASSRGEVVEVNERFTFGPYPDKVKLEELEAEGYDGVITLLSTALIFEKQLLDEERQNGDAAGIDILSFPMLPWIGDNQESIRGLQKLVGENENRYYVHCYLGKHRVDTAKQVILSEMGQQAEISSFLLDPTFERGDIYAYKDEQIMLGPYPTDEEWFTTILRRQVKEVVSTLPPDSSLYVEAQQIAADNGLKWTSFPLTSDVNSDLVLDIAKYVKQQPHKVYVHTFNNNNQFYALELALSKGIKGYNLRAIERQFEPNQLTAVGRGILLGPAPDADQLAVLKEEGIEQIRLLRRGAGAVKAEADMKAAGLDAQVISLPEGRSAVVQALYAEARSVVDLQQTVYIYSDSADVLKQLESMLMGMYRGLESSPHERMNLVQRDVLLGPELKEQQWIDVILAKGMERVIYLHSPSQTTVEDMERQEQLAGKFHIDFQSITLYESYRDELIDTLSSDPATTYLVVPELLYGMIADVITDH